MLFYPCIHQRIHHHAVSASQSGGIADADPHGSASWSGEIREGKEKKKAGSAIETGGIGAGYSSVHEGRFQFMYGCVFLLGFIGFSEIMKKKLNRVSEITNFNLFFYVVRKVFPLPLNTTSLCTYNTAFFSSLLIVF